MNQLQVPKRGEAHLPVGLEQKLLTNCKGKQQFAVAGAIMLVSGLKYILFDPCL